MDYETGKNFEKVQALLEEHEQKLEYLMTKLAEKTVVKKPVVATKPVEPVKEEETEDEAVEDIVEQEYEEPTVKPKKKKRWGRPTEEKEEEPARIL